MSLSKWRQRLIGLFAWRPGTLAIGTLSMSVGMGLRTVGQAGVFLIVARVLGVESYGAYAAILAIATTLGTFGGLGAQTLMLRDVARDPAKFGLAWGRALLSIAVSGPILFLIYLLIGWILLPAGIPWLAVVLIGAAELLFAPTIFASFTAYQSRECIGRAGRLAAIPILPRLAAALLLLSVSTMLVNEMRLMVWSLLYAVSMFLAAAYSVRVASRDLGRPIRPPNKQLRDRLSGGLAFASGRAALKLYSDIDKTMLARLSTLEAAGIYSVGYRVVEITLVPLNALLATAAPRFFRVGAYGVRAALSYAWRILPLPLFYVLAVGAALYCLAGWLPLILGITYRPAVSALRWLSWLPLVSLPRFLLQPVLLGVDRQEVLVKVLGVGAVIDILLNLVLIPLWGWRGAVISVYVAEVAMGAVLWAFVTRSQRAT